MGAGSGGELGKGGVARTLGPAPLARVGRGRLSPAGSRAFFTAVWGPGRRLKRMLTLQ